MSTRVEATAGSIAEAKADAIAVGLFQDAPSLSGAAAAVDGALGGLLGQLRAQGEITGRLNTATVVHTQGRLPSPRVVVVGLGAAESFDLRRARLAAAGAALAARKAGVSRLATVVHGAGAGGQDPGRAAAALVEASLVALYRYSELKTRHDGPGELEELSLVESDPGRLALVAEGARLGAVLGEATNLCRDLTMRPPNHCTPALLAEAARELGQRLGLEVEVKGRPDIEQLGLEAILAVGRGSDEPPQLIVLKHHGGKAADAPEMALVGKGITFDAGGLSLKTTRSIEHMKSDMAGAAAVIAAVAAASRLKVGRELWGIIPAVENLPSGHATRPGDVVRMQNGQTVEIANCDAEGRLCLADAVGYAHRLGARRVVDIATLTGSCVQALGNYTSGLLSNDRALEAAVAAAAEEAGERVWPLPLFEEYWELLRSDTADFRNSGITPKAGVILGALIIGRQAQSTPWAHLDIAGTAWLEEKFGYLPIGATGAGTRTLALLALRLPGGEE